MLRCALVTGAAQGMGRAIALRLARDGLDVAVNDSTANSIELINTEKEIEKLGRKSTSIIADVSNEKEVESMMQDVSKYLGSLDVGFLNNLGDIHFVCLSRLWLLMLVFLKASH